jgi:hypothetical protein
VYILFDNDTAGVKGTDKAKKIVLPVAAETYTMQWPEGTAKGYDVRDVYTKQFKGDVELTLDWLEEHCVKVKDDEQNTVQTSEARVAPVPCTEVYDVYQKWLHMPNTELIDIIYGTILANRIPGDPVWMFVVAPPGATKTEPLMSLTGSTRIETVSTLTAPSLISGANMGGSDPSLIPQLNNKVLIVKDFTAVIGLPFNEREEIFSILRDAYDGECAKPFGNGITRRYKSRFGILAAVTPAIEQFTEEFAQLGERFLRWRNWVSEDYGDRKVFIARALGNVGLEKEMRTELTTMAKRVLLAQYESIPSVNEVMQDRIIAMSQWIATLRTTVVRDKFSRDVTYHPFSELGTRISKELLKLAMGIAQFKGKPEITDKELNVCAAVARSTVSSRYLSAVRVMLKQQDKEFTVVEMQEAINLPRSTIETVMGNLVMLGVAERVKDQKIRWVLTDKFIQLNSTGKVIV